MYKVSLISSLNLLFIVNFSYVHGKPQIAEFTGCGGLDNFYPFYGNYYPYPWSNPCSYLWNNQCCDTSSEGQELVVTVYYETLSEDSQRFFYYQINPIYKELGPRFILHLVPWGKTKFALSPTGLWTTVCHHGDAECQGNKIHACLLKNPDIPDQDKFEFIVCTMNAWTRTDTVAKVDQFAKECAEKHKIDLNNINNCVKTLGDYYMYQSKSETDQIKMYIPEDKFFVPTIVFNGAFKDADQTKALKNFKEVLCSYLSSGTKGC